MQAHEVRAGLQGLNHSYSNMKLASVACPYLSVRALLPHEIAKVDLSIDAAGESLVVVDDLRPSDVGSVHDGSTAGGDAQTARVRLRESRGDNAAAFSEVPEMEAFAVLPRHRGC